MRQPWFDVYRGLVTTLTDVGLLFLALIFGGLYFHLSPGPWQWAILLVFSLAAAGFYRGWVDSTLLRFLAGNSLAMLLLVVAAAVLPDPIAVISPAEHIARMVYTPLFAAVPAAIGFASGRLLRKAIRRKWEGHLSRRKDGLNSPSQANKKIEPR
ncbi:MAG: hypothetical protein ACOY7U_02205 [Acidobacteriota bacterium]